MSKNNIKIILNEKEKSASVIIEKDFSINTIDQIKSELHPVFEKVDNLTIELLDIDNFDLTSIQLLHSLKLNKEKKVKIKAKIKDDLRNIVINSGFKELLN